MGGEGDGSVDKSLPGYQSVSQCSGRSKKKKVNQHTSYKAMRSVCASECVDGVNDRVSRCLSG